MKNIVAFLVIFFCVAAKAQTTKVIPLSSDESKEISNLYSLKASIEERLDIVKMDLYNKYICKSPSIAWVSGYFDYGFEFSDDYKYILPKKNANLGSCLCVSSGGNYYYCPCTPTYNIYSGGSITDGVSSGTITLDTTK